MVASGPGSSSRRGTSGRPAGRRRRRRRTHTRCSDTRRPQPRRSVTSCQHVLERSGPWSSFHPQGPGGAPAGQERYQPDGGQVVTLWLRLEHAEGRIMACRGEAQAAFLRSPKGAPNGARLRAAPAASTSRSCPAARRSPASPRSSSSSPSSCRGRPSRSASSARATPPAGAEAIPPGLARAPVCDRRPRRHRHGALRPAGDAAGRAVADHPGARRDRDLLHGLARPLPPGRADQVNNLGTLNERCGDAAGDAASPLRSAAAGASSWPSSPPSASRQAATCA